MHKSAESIFPKVAQLLMEFSSSCVRRYISRTKFPTLSKVRRERAVNQKLSRPQSSRHNMSYFVSVIECRGGQTDGLGKRPGKKKGKKRESK